ncbi:LppA family lipoprotein [Amycolatopsis palatopharyngis]|uniref:LppA family lipoprotein n=1 Tax=Amycolatopsis palatopharyngis TaxID=187982 RepID=UPI0013BE9C60|nr:LppA family lipoprotein [Amycolatopsis palatopharyngis]
MELGLTRAPLRKLALAVVLTGLLSACVSEGSNINDDPNAGTQQQQYDTLLQRPDIEQVTDTYQAALDEIKGTLAKKFGLPEWEHGPYREIGEAACGFDFPDVDGRQGITRTISGGFSRSTIPDDRWEESVQIITEIANKYGFKGPERVADKPGNREIRYFDAAGSRLSFGQVKNMSISISTGCHLTPEAHQRGGPPPEETR